MENLMIVESLSDIEYHAKPHLSSHQLKEFLRSPAHYKALFEKPRKASKAMEIGTCIHMALLEPDRFQAAINFEETCDRRSKAGKELYEIWQNSLSPVDIVVSGRSTRPQIDNIVITAADLDNIKGMQRAYYSHPWVAKLHTSGLTHKNEVSVFQEFEGVELRSRFDKIVDGKLIDLKKTQDARPHVFLHDFKRYGYALQMAFYRLVYKLEFGEYPKEVIIIAIEEQYPHAVVPMIVDEMELEAKEQQIFEALEHFQWCKQHNDWAGVWDNDPYYLHVT
jgi:exodeoxyribonuclease VIII